MRKNLLVVSVLLLACILALAGCSKAKALEKDVQVVLDVNGTIAGTVTVNSFNNAVISEPQAPANTVFRGWTVQSSWADDASDVKFIQNKGLVRYDDVKDAVKGDARSVVLHAVFAAAPKKDLVIAWYSKESTSGLNQGHMDAFLAKLNAYLESVGKKGLDIGIRAYDGGVADTCAAIKKDGDVDIMVGWSST
ncbi:MAG: hypothetical protein IJT52_02005, partial [Spirochaetales bacterium]|nr:hypothetical protein [Spirochaetales bacterium]